MAKGMSRGTYFHSDPTYEKVLAKFNREARQGNGEVKPWRLSAMITALAEAAGYTMFGEFSFQSKRSGMIYRSGRQEDD